MLSSPSLLSPLSPFINALTSPCCSLQNTQIFELCHRFIMARRGLGTWLQIIYLAVQPDPSPKSGKCGEGLGTRLVWFLDRSCMQPKEYDGSRAWNGLKMIQYSRIRPLQTICAHVLCIKLSSYADTELSCKVQLSCCNHFCSISTHYKKHHQVHCCNHRYHNIKRTSICTTLH